MIEIVFSDGAKQNFYVATSTSVLPVPGTYQAKPPVYQYVGGAGGGSNACGNFTPGSTIIFYVNTIYYNRNTGEIIDIYSYPIEVDISGGVCNAI